MFKTVQMLPVHRYTTERNKYNQLNKIRLKIPTGRKQTSRLFTKRDRGFKRRTTEKKIPLVADLWLRLCLCLRQGYFYDKMRIILFALVLASQVKTRLKNREET